MPCQVKSMSELSVTIIICIQIQQVLCVEKLVQASLCLGLMVQLFEEWQVHVAFCRERVVVA
jgi:hypothetical protein